MRTGGAEAVVYSIVNRTHLLSRRLRAKNKEIAALFAVDSLPIREPASEEAIGVAEIILIVIAAIIFVVAIIMIAILLVSWRRSAKLRFFRRSRAVCHTAFLLKWNQ